MVDKKDTFLEKIFKWTGFAFMIMGAVNTVSLLVGGGPVIDASEGGEPMGLEISIFLAVFGALIFKFYKPIWKIFG